MKKFLLTLVGVICSLGMWADEATIYWESDIVAANEITLSNGFKLAITGNTEKKWSSGNGDIKLNSTAYKTLKNSNGAQNTLTAPSGSTISAVKFYAVANATADGKLSEFEGTSCSDAVTSQKDYSNPTVIEKSLATPAQSVTFTFNTKQVCFIAVVTYSSGSASDPSITAKDATIKAGKSGVAATTTVDVTGANLTGTTLTATLSPAVDGLSVSLDQSTITNGAITAVATLSYTATANASGKTTLTLSDGTTSKDVAVTYSASVVKIDLQSISAATTWDFSKTAVASDADASLKADDGIKLVNADETKGIVATDPTPDEDVVYANADYITLADGFDGTSISFKGTYPTRKGMCQAGTLHFKTTVPGNVTVDFSDTGSSVSSSATPRYLVVNGNKTVYWTSRPTSGSTKSNDEKTVMVPVPAGDVTITGSQAQCYYKVTFTPATVDVEKTLGTNGYSTYCSDYAFTAKGADVYKATYANDLVSLEKIEGVVPAGEGVVLYGEGTNVTISPAIEAAATVENNDLVGVSSATTAFATTGVNYVLSSKGTETGFVQMASDKKVEDMVGKAYLVTPGKPADEAKSIIYISFEGTPTAVSSVEAKKNVANGVAYNLAGQRVNASAKGIIIVNGKKYVK